MKSPTKWLHNLKSAQKFKGFVTYVLEGSLEVLVWQMLPHWGKGIDEVWLDLSI